MTYNQGDKPHHKANWTNVDSYGKPTNWRKPHKATWHTKYPFTFDVTNAPDCKWAKPEAWQGEVETESVSEWVKRTLERWG